MNLNGAGVSQVRSNMPRKSNLNKKFEAVHVCFKDEESCNEVSTEELEEICEAFHLLDQDNEGFINARKLFSAMRAFGYNPTEAEVLDLISAIDTEGSSKITLDEFISMTSGKIKKMTADEELIDTFKVFDVDCSGQITVDDIEKLFFKLGQTINREELREMMASADLLEEDAITYADFVSIYKDV